MKDCVKRTCYCNFCVHERSASLKEFDELLAQNQELKDRIAEQEQPKAIEPLEDIVPYQYAELEMSDLLEWINENRAKQREIIARMEVER